MLASIAAKKLKVKIFPGIFLRRRPFRSECGVNLVASGAKNYQPKRVDAGGLVEIGPAAGSSMDIGSTNWKLEISLTTDFTTPPMVAGPRSVPTVDPNFSFSFSTTTSNNIGPSLGAASGLYGSQLVSWTPASISYELQAAVLCGVLCPLNPKAAGVGFASTVFFNELSGTVHTSTNLMMGASTGVILSPLANAYNAAAGNNVILNRVNTVKFETLGFGMTSMLQGSQ